MHVTGTELNTQWPIKSKGNRLFIFQFFHDELQDCGKFKGLFFSAPEPKVCPSTLSNMNISETSWPIIIKFHQEHHWGGGLTAIGFGLDRIRTLVSMATDSSHRVIMGKIL